MIKKTRKKKQKAEEEVSYSLPEAEKSRIFFVMRRSHFHEKSRTVCPEALK